MANETVMLAKSYNEKKVEFPCYVGEKYDGVACRFEWKNGEVVGTSRQGKPIPSAALLAKKLEEALPKDRAIIGELIVPGLSFKDAGGIIRRDRADPSIELMMYDYVEGHEDNRPFYDRMQALFYLPTYELSGIQIASLMYCNDPISFSNNLETVMQTQHHKPFFEGAMIRSASHTYKSGSRSWGMMRYVLEPTIDLRVVGLEEAVSKDGKPKGMLGAFEVEYLGDVIKVGAGKMSHTDRVYYWNNQNMLVGKIIECKYKKDEDYKALRQPTFQSIRWDKSEPDA